jgi:hypothetical protein
VLLPVRRQLHQDRAAPPHRSNAHASFGVGVGEVLASAQRIHAPRERIPAPGCPRYSTSPLTSQRASAWLGQIGLVSGKLPWPIGKLKRESAGREGRMRCECWRPFRSLSQPSTFGMSNTTTKRSRMESAAWGGPFRTVSAGSEQRTSRRVMQRKCAPYRGDRYERRDEVRQCPSLRRSRGCPRCLVAARFNPSAAASP